MKILIADDEPAARYAMAKTLRAEGREILEAGDGEVALSIIQEHAPDLVFLDLHMPIKDGIAVLAAIQSDPTLTKPEIIVVTANDTVNHAIECIRRGASDFLAKPYDVDHVRAMARRSEERVALQSRVASLQTQVDSVYGLGSMLGMSRPMRHLFGQLERAARSRLPVLLRGESGTGKELVARELHARSDRSNGPFIAINTAAIAETLIESELFGHVKGAFTGADRPREGVFRQANGGTLFLDEIGDMPLPVQTRLLRVVQESIVQPVGSEENISVDVRIISATHQDLNQAIAEKLFRQDLYYRLCGIELVLPPLRARHEDILLMANEFLGEGRTFSNESIACLLQHPWPGNVRELKQRVQAAAAMTDNRTISPMDLGLLAPPSTKEVGDFDRFLDLPLTEARNQLLEDFDRTAILRALELDEGNISAAARRLSIHRQSLQQKMKQLGIKSDLLSGSTE